MSLAVGIAQIFSGLPGMRGLMAYWYHFAIMFEALFILTTIDTGTRVGRFLVQEFLGRFYEPFGATRSGCPASSLDAARRRRRGRYFIRTGSISTIWPMFGIANQLLASVALAVGTTIIINMGKARYAWVTAAAARVRVGDDADRRRAERPRQLLADGDRARPATPLPGLPQHGPDGHHDGLRARGHPGERAVALHAGAARQNRDHAGNRPLRRPGINRLRTSPRACGGTSPRRLALNASSAGSQTSRSTEIPGARFRDVERRLFSARARRHGPGLDDECRMTARSRSARRCGRCD